MGQIAAAAVLVLFDIRIEWLNNPWGGYFYLEYLSIPFTIFWVISFTNVVNLMDGLDGLAAGVAGIASITVILVGILSCCCNYSCLGWRYCRFYAL